MNKEQEFKVLCKSTLAAGQSMDYMVETCPLVVEELGKEKFIEIWTSAAAEYVNDIWNEWFGDYTVSDSSEE